VIRRLSGLRLSVRSRLLLALALLAAATLAVGVMSWIGLTRGTERMDLLHSDTLVEVDGALTLSQQASDLATLAPYLLTLDSPFRIRQDGARATLLVDAIAQALAPDAALRGTMAQTEAAIAELLRETQLRAGLRDRILRLNAALADADRSFAARTGQPSASVADRQDWLLQRLSAALLGAGRAENLISVGEFQREYVGLIARAGGQIRGVGMAELAHLRAIAEGDEGVFELRRLELASGIRAEAAVVRIRQGAAAVTRYSAEVTAEAQARIAAERSRTSSAIWLIKTAILIFGLISALVALSAALYVSSYVTANLRAISGAMMRLAGGDRQTRLPRGTGSGDEIGKLFYAFRYFRANALRLDRSNRQMAQRTALFDNVMLGISDGMAILSDQGAVLTRNGRLAEVLRLNPARLKGRPILSAVIAEAGWVKQGGPQGFADLTHGDGRHAEWRESPLPGVGSVVLVSDATERKQMDSRLSQIQRIEALGKVSGEVAHDFGNILSTISGSLHLIETASPERQAGLRQTAASAVDLGVSLTQRLLSFARRQQLEPETVELNQLAEGMADLIGFALRDGIVLEVQTSAEPLRVCVDPGQMESALLNLCLNAGQAIEGTGTITVSINAQGDQVVLEVSDTGSGMTPEVLAHAMEPFFTARRDGTGTGLGLAMVYGFIRQSGGDVQIISRLGEGTRVRLLLPLQGPHFGREAPRLRCVLVVEDSPEDMRRAMALIAPLAARVITCDSTASAFEQILGQSPDLIVSDLSLNGTIAGWQIADAALCAAPQTRALVVSGHLPAVNPLAARHGDRIRTLSKPLSAKTLAEAITELFTESPNA
jgi:signal transduction histidine kinase